MTAKEMFEELGYEMVQSDSTLIKYERVKDKNAYTFRLKEKAVDVDTDDEFDDRFEDEMKACEQQERELGWLD